MIKKKMSEKPSYYATIPGYVRYDKDLKDKAKLLYGEITALSNKEGYCFASNNYFAELYEVSTQTIINMINNLVDKGYLERTIIYKEGTKEIEKRYLKIIEGGTQKILTRGTQKILTRGTQKFLWIIIQVLIIQVLIIVVLKTIVKIYLIIFKKMVLA